MENLETQTNNFITDEGEHEMAREEDFAELVESSFHKVQEGEVVTGIVVQVTSDYVMVDVGSKSEGQIPLEQFLDEKGELTVKVGDEVQVFLEDTEESSGQVKISKSKADKIRIWEEIAAVCETERTIVGRVVARVKGGLQVDIGVPAFLPGSQVDLRPVRNFEKYIGESFEFNVLKYNRKRGNIVLSRKPLLEKQKEERKNLILGTMEGSGLFVGTVKNITDYGAFIDLGGIDGLLHITDMSWGRINHPSDVLKVGDQIQVKVLKFDQDKERVSLGMKQIQPDPWENVEERYPKESEWTGKVVSITDYGVFVELEKGVEGLVHISEMTWTKKPRHPSKLVQVGDEVDVMVLNVDKEQKRISLGMKQLKPNPWDVIAERYPEGTKIEGKIRNVTDFGVFVGIDEGIDGLVHISDISWTQRIKHPGELYKKGQTVQAVVLNIDKENERFSLGIKQMQEDPWETIPDRYPPGAKVRGKVTSVTDFGVFLEIEEGIEGMIHVSELSKERVNSPSDFTKEGEELTAMVLKVNKKDKKIALSIKSLEKTGDYEQVKGYMHSQEVVASNLGDLLKENLGSNFGKE
ncbi:30S ribosomal protein S1 [Desulfomonile tiedjei]|uniref:Small ribosomal subunit protein bS1 n=1 Tax=Desulfomonile tiedjei (strain ATCC 49306 / DSM 6799 / DCB-1) TaxID=706587 RepID=I4C9I7_DESTA|nr:30S ribosomal protein S1 [Desulfomonile tiedjei]AFM26228.1 ribosomal protein S1 [Desulfomonile tiedjei DSM 6799]